MCSLAFVRLVPTVVGRARLYALLPGTPAYSFLIFFRLFLVVAPLSSSDSWLSTPAHRAPLAAHAPPDLHTPRPTHTRPGLSRPAPVMPLVQVNNILQARNDELERVMAEKGVGFLAEAAKAEGAVQTARYFSPRFLT